MGTVPPAQSLAGGSGAPNRPATPAPLASPGAPPFRQEALEHHLGAQRWGETLHLGSAWARRAPLGLVVLALVLLAAGLLLTVDDSVTGAYRVGSDGAGVTAVLPAPARHGLAHGARLDLDLGGGRHLRVPVPATGLGPIAAEDARSRFGGQAIAGLLATSSPLIVTQSRLDRALAASERRSGTATVRLGSRSLLGMLLSGLLDRGPSP